MFKRKEVEFRYLRIQEIDWESLSDPEKWAKSDADNWTPGRYGLVFTPVGTARAMAGRDYESYVFRLE